MRSSPVASHNDLLLVPIKMIRILITAWLCGEFRSRLSVEQLVIRGKPTH